MTKCQSCLERGLEPQEAVGIYQGLPICNECLGPILDNLNNTQVDSIVDPTSLPARKERALAMLDKFEELFEDWPLFEHEVLLSRDDFFNHRPPAIINLTVDQIKAQNSRRKGVLFAFRIKDEHWTSIIDSVKIEERRKQGLEDVAKSLVEKSKVGSKAGKDAELERKKKLAKQLGISVAQLDAMGSQARISEFEGIVGNKVTQEVKQESSTSAILADLQKQVVAQGEAPKPGVVKRCQVCGKLTCICRRN